MPEEKAPKSALTYEQLKERLSVASYEKGFWDKATNISGGVKILNDIIGVFPATSLIGAMITASVFGRPFVPSLPLFIATSAATLARAGDVASTGPGDCEELSYYKSQFRKAANGYIGKQALATAFNLASASLAATAFNMGWNYNPDPQISENAIVAMSCGTGVLGAATSLWGGSNLMKMNTYAAAIREVKYLTERKTSGALNP